MNSDLLTQYPFDLYQRTRDISEIVQIIAAKKSKKQLRILDVGGFRIDAAERENLLLKEFLPDHEIYSMDLEEASIPGYVRGDGTRLPFKDNAFDVVVTSDVFEHIPPDRRDLFVENLIAAAKDFVILGAPFYSLKASMSEEILLEYVHKTLHVVQSQLKEHIDNGLPKAEELQQLLDKRQHAFHVLDSGNLGNWLKMMMVKHYLMTIPDTGHLHNMLDRFYNKNYYESDHGGGTAYRKVFIIAADNLRESTEQDQEAKAAPLKAFGSPEGGHAPGEFRKGTPSPRSGVNPSPRGGPEAQGVLEAVERHFAAYAAKSQGGSEEADLSEIQMLLNLEELRTRRQFSEKDHVINLQAARIAELERMRTTRLYRLITGFNKICFRPFARLFRFFLAKMQQVLRILTGRRRHPFLSISNGAYQRWITKKELSDDDLVILKKSCDNLAQQRLISIVVPVFNTDIRWLDAAIDSVTAQVYQNWELCLVNDGSTEPHVREALESYKAKDKRIKIKHLGRNHGIAGATNAALGMAEGEFIAFMDSDDTLHNTALAEIVLLLHKQPDTDIVFTDEDKLTLDGKRRKPVFKPGWSAEKFLTCNYINHLTVCRKTLVDKVGGFRAEFDWSQDYDLYLRMVEQTENDKIIHLPKVLYHWRMVPGSSAAKVDTRAEALAKSKLLLQETLRRRGIKGTVTEGLQPGTFKIKRA